MHEAGAKRRPFSTFLLRVRKREEGTVLEEAKLVTLVRPYGWHQSLATDPQADEDAGRIGVRSDETDSGIEILCLSKPTHERRKVCGRPPEQIRTCSPKIGTKPPHPLNRFGIGDITVRPEPCEMHPDVLRFGNLRALKVAASVPNSSELDRIGCRMTHAFVPRERERPHENAMNPMSSQIL